MADILYYAALDKYLFQDTQLASAQNQKTRADTRLTASKCTLKCCICCYQVEEAAKQQRQLAAGTIYCLNAQIYQDPTCIELWESVPKKFSSTDCTSYDGFFCVGDPSNCSYDPTDQACLNSCCNTCGYASGGYYRCGGCYVWTVPAGVCCVEVELWGAGSWTTGACCCGGAPFAPNGAHVFVNMTVCPGEIYCFCAGCSACCTCACSNGWAYVISCGSTICGPGISYCAPGASSWLQNQMARGYAASPGACAYRVAGPNCINNFASGGCWCNSGGNWCNQSCASCGVISMTHAGNFPRGCITPTRPGNTYVVGSPGFHGCFCYDTNNYGYYMSPPVIGFVNVSQCCEGHSSGSCHGCDCRAGCGYNPWPGQGGTRTHAMGGQTNCKGDNGRTGWIRVRYCCI